MRLTAFFLIVFCLQVSANKGTAQTITLSGQDLPLVQVFSEIKRQTGYLVFYDMEAVKAVAPISVSAKNLPLKLFLIEALKNSKLAWSIKNGNVIISQLDQPAIKEVATPAPVEVTGIVMGTDGIYLPGAFIKVKGTNNGTASDGSGKFTITANVGETLVITFIGFQSKEVIVPTSRTLRIVLEKYVSKLDEAVVQAYGTTSKRLNTGNIDKVSGKDLNEAPVSDPLAALAGRVPGLVITQNTGVAGSAFKVQIRGRTQIDQNNGASDEPLFIIDGVPMATGNNKISLLSSAINGSSATVGLSPFYSINMADIESIEVLKDADATAIYGSRGANGVIMITTRRAKAGATRFNLRAETGGSRVKLPDLLSTKDYVAMRKEAFRNDNKAMTTANAYDLLLWDTTRDNNLAKQLIGGTATMTNIQGTLSGGNNLVQFLVGGGYFRETDVYPGTFPNSRASANFNITSRSADQKFTAVVSGNFTSALNTSTSTDLASKLVLPPNFQIYDSLGGLMWNEKGVNSDNPLAYMLSKYTAKTDNLNANVNLSYNILKGLYIRSNIGYNQVKVDELAITPKTSINPNLADLARARFGNNNFKSWIVEPQIDYNTYIGKGSLNVLGGATFQSQRNNGYSFGINGYTSDEFLGSLIGIPATAFVNPSSVLNEYKYQAFFGRLTYNYSNKYLVNFSGRRDGSSRFGPDFRFSNFGAVGAAWLFSNEDFMKTFPAISYGKLRGSYGITGNDKIGEYKYIDSYTANAFYPTYKDSAAFTPTSLFKPDLHWEKNLKLEFALELGFLQDRILFTGAWYRNHSSDPLVDYPLPLTTGFTSITANLAGVLLENKGWEFSLNTTNIRSKDFNWTTNFNFSVPKNKLLRFPNLSQTSYASKYIIGQPLNLVFVSKNLGVDPQTGLYVVEDLNKNGTYQVSAVGGDLQPLFNTDPKFYGGMQNNFSYKGFQLGVFLQFSSQKGRNWLASLASSGFIPIPVGGLQNVPYIALNRWQKPGDITPYQKFTTNVTTPTNGLTGSTAVSTSDATYSDASYLRLKTLSLSYDLPGSWLKKIKMNSVRVYVHAQNLFTFTRNKDSDPETAFMFKLPPLRTITAGIQVNI